MTETAQTHQFLQMGQCIQGAPDSNACRPVHDLAVSLMQLHILHSNRHDLLPSDDLVRINAFAIKLATFLDGVNTRQDFFEALGRLEAAVDVLNRQHPLACAGTGSSSCLLEGRGVCIGTSDCQATKVTDPEILALLDMAKQQPIDS